ncbi:amidohydrolase [Fodinicola acaciae]|uniref:amidohydrolase n=1 Tax=Fodinicola acaciae TaxID=2681555 RepID=UPI0013D6265B|nr:amidohydrolase [Fodinicola acaciae]
MTADLVITGAAIYGTPATAIAIRAGRIAALGDAALAMTGPKTERLELPGRLVVPGFQDAHVHTPYAGRDLLRVCLNELDGKDAYLAAISAYAQAHPDEEWITGGGWSMEHFPGGVPSKVDLDRIVPDRPVFLFNRDVHGAWVNSAALRIAGITAQTPDPSDGRIERDAAGEPVGMLQEGAAYTFRDRWLPALSRQDWEAAILRGQQFLHRLGITGWQDAWVTPETLAAYRSLDDAGKLTARVAGALWWERHAGLEQIPAFVEQASWGSGGNISVRTVKIMADGVLENYTGAVLEPYHDGCGGRTDNVGLSYVDSDTLAAAVTELDRIGFGVHMHAIGDRAARDCLDAVAAARKANGDSENRHHIAHIQMIDPADVPRFAQLGVTANMQAYWAQRDDQMEELTRPYLGAERTDRMYPFADLKNAGARLAAGSDWPVSTPDPLAQIEVAARRISPLRRDDQPFLPEQAVSVRDSLDAFTKGSAFVSYDDEAGEIAVGKRADLAVLDRDILAIPDAKVADASVELTIAAGHVVHTR